MLSHLRIQSKACVKTCGAMQCSCWRIWHCSRVTDMAVRSFALLQLVTRTPFRRRQIWRNKWERYHPGKIHSNYFQVWESLRSQLHASKTNWIVISHVSVLLDHCTSAACNRMSTFLLFLALTFWLRNLSSSGTQIWLRERGRPIDGVIQQVRTDINHLPTFFHAECLGLTVFRQHFFKLVIIGGKASQTLHIHYFLQRRVSKPKVTQNELEYKKVHCIYKMYIVYCILTVQWITLYE